jgi:hypothetical protein
MEGDLLSISPGTKFGFNSRTDRIQQTMGHESINHNSTCDEKDVPEIFSGTVDVIEIFRAPLSSCTVWAEVIEDIGSDTLQPLISQ